MKRLWIEGWRGISHSFAMVNQHQMLAWLDEPDLQLGHRDLPFFKPGWNAQTMGAGFDEVDTARLMAVGAWPAGTQADAIYRIAFPAPAPSPDPIPQLTFMVTEYGLSPASLGAPVADLAAYTRNANRVLTPSHWSRALIVDFGFDAARVEVVPHAVQRRTFAPYPSEERQQRRRALGFADEHFLFANVGVASWNKGLDHLLVAFARLVRQFPQARLLVKNNQTMYGASVDAIVRVVKQTYPGLLSDAVMEAVFVVDTNLDQAALRELYACSDCYVSPYRAEGFNLPVLEALACGTPTVVTAGGATDDFCDGPWATRVASRPAPTPVAVMAGGRSLEIEPDALLQAMIDRLQAPRPSQRLSGEAWSGMLDRYSWPRVARQILDLAWADRP